MSAKRQAFPNCIDGYRAASSDGRSFAPHNPANLDEVAGVLPDATVEDAARGTLPPGVR